MTINRAREARSQESAALGFGLILTRTAFVLAPRTPEQTELRGFRSLTSRLSWLRMYLVGVINKIARDYLKGAAISQSGPTVARMLDAWGIHRSKPLRSSSDPNLLTCVTTSPSQMGQDALALMMSGRSDTPFFVEAGACDGIYCSNTLLLEKEYGWTGILCEPARVWHQDLHKNRQCVIDGRALWSTSGEQLQFRQTELPNLSTLDGFVDRDLHAQSRQAGEVYDVESISLRDLLSVHNAPSYIDFLSLDTEGTELAILENFPFDEYSFGFIACEHNNTDNYAHIVCLLENNGYILLSEFRAISLGDAWFVGPRLHERLRQLRSGHY